MTAPARCRYCWGKHKPDTPMCYVEFDGRRYRPPFQCLCCGKEICGPQFAFGRNCGYCDMGRCQKGLRAAEEGDSEHERRFGMAVIREPGHTNGWDRKMALGEPIPSAPLPP